MYLVIVTSQECHYRIENLFDIKLIDRPWQGLADARDLQGVCGMVDEMKATPTCVLDRIAYTAIIDACIAAGSPQRESFHLLQFMFNGNVDLSKKFVHVTKL